MNVNRMAWRDIWHSPTAWAAGVVLAITMLAAWARLDQLGSWGFWRDEAQCIFIAQKSFPSGIVHALLHEAHPPLYYSLQHAWIGLVGWSEFRIRLLSAVLGIATVPALFIIGRRFFGTWAGLGAALFGALAPLHVAVSQTARMYSLLALLALLSMGFLYEAWQRGGWWWAGYVICTIGLLYTHNWGLFLLIAQNGFALWRFVRRGEPSGRPYRAWMIAQAIVGLCYLPWVFALLQQVQIIAVLPFVPVPSPAEKLWQLAGDLLVPWPAMLIWLGLLALGLWPRQRVSSVGEADGALALVIWCAFGTLGLGLLVSLRTYGQVPSYTALSAWPALCLLLGRGLAQLSIRLEDLILAWKTRFSEARAPAANPSMKNDGYAWITIPVVIIMAFFSMQGLGRARFMFRSTLREVAWRVEQQAGPDDVIVIAPDYLAPTFNMYFRGKQSQIAFPWVMRRLEEIDCVGWNDRWLRAAEAVPATLDEIETRLGQAGRLWLIAALDEFPEEEVYYGQIRRLKGELDARYRLERVIDEFRNATEWADIYVYSRPS